MPIQFPELPGWSFNADEVSIGVYRAFGQDLAGHRVETTGLDPITLIDQCKHAALRMMANPERPHDMPNDKHQ